MAEFIDAHGNLLKADVEALANSVNTVGVMGKGIALQFKNAFPANFEAYEAACNKQAVRLGEVFVFDNGRLTTPRWIIYFPTIRRSTTAPNADNLRHVLKSLEGHQLEGFVVRSPPPTTSLRVAMPTIVTTNRGLPDWGDIFGDSVIAAAILDRLMHNAVIFNIKGPSWRLREHHGLEIATTTNPR